MASQWDMTMRRTQPSNWWRFSEPGGTEAKDLYGGYHVSLTGSRSDWSATGLVLADHDKAAKFGNDVAFYSPKLPPAMASSSMSMAFIMTVPQAGYGSGNLVQAATLSRGVVIQYTSASSELDVMFLRSGGVDILNGTVPKDGQPHLIVIQATEHGGYLFIDGEIADEIDGPTDWDYEPPQVDNEPLVLGGYNTVFFDAPIIMDEMALWTRPLSVVEIDDLMEAISEAPDHSVRLSWLPRHVTEDPYVLDLMATQDYEALRYDNAWQDLLEQLFSQTATWGLRYWEQSLQLPVEPYGQSLEQRRTVVLTTIQAKDAVSGEEFNAALSSVSNAYQLKMDWATSTLLVTINYNPNDYLEAQLETILRALVPAHLSFNVQYEAFIVGVSTAGDTI